MSSTVHRIAVLSDLHANARALDACLSRASERGFDDLVILGDLLTYGADVEAVLERVGELTRTRGARLLVGNHDWLYRDLVNGDTRYYDSLPQWLRESADWTLSRVNAKAFEALPWEEEVVIGSVLFSHANPFGSRNFRYLNHRTDVLDAAQALAGRPVVGGCFGHTHRPALVSADAAGGDVTDHGDSVANWAPPSPGCRLIANPGSIGQPRGGDGRPSFMLFTASEGDVSVGLERVEYDVGAHVAAVAGMNLSEQTVGKLVGFFRPSDRDQA